MSTTEPTNATPNGWPLDTRLRTLPEVMTRLVNPIPAALIGSAEGADYVNVTTLKDLLDWAAGFGRWRAEVVPHQQPVMQTLYSKRGNVEEGLMYALTVRLHVQVHDEVLGSAVWLSQDGTGTELLSGPKVFGDALTNAYAQGLRRAAESFGLARELWRRDAQKNPIVSKPQQAAHAYLREHGKHAGAQEVPKVMHDEAERQLSHTDPEAQPRPTAPASGGTSGTSATARAASATTESASAPSAPTTTAEPEQPQQTKAQQKAHRMLAELAAEAKVALGKGGKTANPGQFQLLDNRGGALAKRLAAIQVGFDLHQFVEDRLDTAMQNLNFAAAKLLIDTFTEWLKEPKGAAKGGAK